MKIRNWSTLIATLFLALLPLLVLANPSPKLKAATPPAEMLFFNNLKAGKKQTVAIYGTSLSHGGEWARAVTQWFNAEYPGLVDVVNSSGPGKNSDWALANLPRVLGRHPNLIFIEFSYNDSVERFKMPVERGAANLAGIVESIQKQDPNTAIVLQVMNVGWDAPNGRRSYSTRPELEKYNDNYRVYAREHGLSLLDHYPNWLRLKETDPRRFEAYVPDGTHPNAEGSLAITWPTVKAWLEKTRAASGTAEILQAAASSKPLPKSGPQVVETDVCVYGGGAGGVSAAVQAAREGKRVALLVFNSHLGGMSSSGLGATDLGTPDTSYIQGIAREFYQRIAAKYHRSGVQWNFEPHVAEAVFNDLVREAGVAVYLNRRLAKATLEQGRITQIATENGDLFRAKVFLDASYEGDLLKQAGVSYTVGREANSQYGETINGIQLRTFGNNLPNGIDPYVKKGDPSSGLLPGVNADAGGPDGSADSKVQAYCYRMCLTNRPNNRVPVGQPAGYKESDYELLFRAIEVGQTGRFFKLDGMPNGKTDSNNASGISCDYIGFNYEYPEADYATRARIAKAHENWQRGLIWTLQNHPRVPEAIRKEYAPWGLPADEFKDNNNWPYELYIREARRMISDYIMTEKNCTGEVVAPDSAGLARYTMDSHNCQRHVLKGMVKNEGNVQKQLKEPFPVSYRSLVPKQGECSNLLVPWSVSASHVAFASIRMEPVYMILGQSAGAAACLAIDEGCPVQAVPYEKLKAQLLKDGQALTPKETPKAIPREKPKLVETALQAKPFDLRDVQLLESPFKHNQDRTRQLLLTINWDRLLYPFRREAGIPSPVKGPDSMNYSQTGHLLGHYLSACAQLYRNTGDQEVKKKADAAVAVLAECQQKLGTGFIGGFPERTFNFKEKPNDPPVNAIVPWYCLHKVYAGLLDMHVLGGNRQALDVLKKAADWADNRTGQLSEARMQAMLMAEHGGMNEVMANLYAVTGDPKHLALSLRFNHLLEMEPFARGEDTFDGAHANTRIPKFIGLARQAMLTSGSVQKASATNFWEFVTADRSYVTGGNSLYERFSPKGYLSHFVTGWSCESCNEYNMLKLTRDLFEMEPKAGYADYYERTLYNHILSSRHPETGGQIYFQLLQSGHYKGEPAAFSGWRFLFNENPDDKTLGTESSCCSGSGLESNTKYADSIYFHNSGRELFVNLFIPSVLNWKENGMVIKQETTFPETGATKLSFSGTNQVSFALRIRHPWWATKQFQIVVNGQNQAAQSQPGGYAKIERVWKEGDSVEVIMPMSFRLEGFKDNPKRAALMYGPLVMAGITEHENPFSAIVSGDDRFLESLKPVPGKPLEFTAPAELFRLSPLKVLENPVVIRPLCQIFKESYAIYWDVLAPGDFQQKASILKAELARQQTDEPKTVDLVLCESLSGGKLTLGNMFTFQSWFLKGNGTGNAKGLARTPELVSERAHGAKQEAPKDSQRKYDSYANAFYAEMPFNLFGTFRWIDPGASCSYRMKVAPQTPQVLQVRLWQARLPEKISFPQGSLEILVEGKEVGRCAADTLPRGEFSVINCPLPPELLKDKQTIEVTLRVPTDSQPVYGIYECRTVIQ